MKILIGVCLSKKNFRYLNLFINDINKIIVPENSYLKIFFILNKKDNINKEKILTIINSD